MAVNFYFSEVHKFPFKINLHKSWVREVILSYGYTVGDLSFVFCSDDYLLKMNIEFLNHDYYTDVITFDYCEDKRVSGDIFISIDRVADNANQNHVAYMVELQRVIIHGTLHLLGFDDVSDILKENMTRAENSALELFYTVK